MKTPKLLGKIKRKTSPPAPLLIKERGAVRWGEVHLLHLITLTYLTELHCIDMFEFLLFLGICRVRYDLLSNAPKL